MELLQHKIIKIPFLPQDDLSRCPTPEPDTCYGRVTNVQGSTDVPVTQGPTVPVTQGPGGGAERTGAVAMLSVVMASTAMVLF